MKSVLGHSLFSAMNVDQNKNEGDKQPAEGVFNNPLERPGDSMLGDADAGVSKHSRMAVYNDNHL